MNETDTHPALIAHLDCSSGVSGDKFLGALLEVGAQTRQFGVEHLQALADAFKLDVTVQAPARDSQGVAATGVTVLGADGRAVDAVDARSTIAGTGGAPGSARPTQSLPPVADARATVTVAPTPTPTPAHSHSHDHSPASARSWAEIRALIEGAPADVLPPAARDAALKVFTALAAAEARVHGVPADTLHFHEVGSADSIIDICGACLGLELLGVGALYATPPALGSGTVETQHGVLPVPAPATAAILASAGIPTSMSNATGELTTPTGAALLTRAAGFGPVPPLRPLLVGYGAGTRDIGQPNICRLIVGEPDRDAPLPLTTEVTTLLETNIDHVTPEAVSYAGEELLAEGALDVWVTPIAMKKGRAALSLSVLARPAQAEALAARIVALTGTLGVRVCEQPRLTAAREELSVETPWGAVQVKFGGGRYRAEHDDIARIAHEHGIDYPEVLSTLNRCIKQQLEC